MHEPVLLNETVQVLRPRSGGTYIDGTVGAGGHAIAILEASAPDGQLFGLDRDERALAVAERQLAKFGDRVHLLYSNFDRLGQAAKQYQIPLASGIFFDLGVSSMQLEQPERGFSFQVDGPLDMRMDTTTGQPAADLVNQLPEDELADLIYQYGEESRSRRIAKAIVKARPIWRTRELADVISQTIGSRPRQGKQRRGKPKIHPATRTFQALRIAVNDELGALERVLPQAIELLEPGGRLAIISFHSLEDRIVKQFFRQESQDCICPPEQPICTCRHKATIHIITKKPITPSLAEIDKNLKARSAKLRVVESIGK
jgi:16S rRNA (cytosine1402-N4)-methyltransferase